MPGRGPEGSSHRREDTRTRRQLPWWYTPPKRRHILLLTEPAGPMMRAIALVKTGVPWCAFGLSELRGSPAHPPLPSCEVYRVRPASGRQPLLSSLLKPPQPRAQGEPGGGKFPCCSAEACLPRLPHCGQPGRKAVYYSHCIAVPPPPKAPGGKYSAGSGDQATTFRNARPFLLELPP
jgi:hypothetical protein